MQTATECGFVAADPDGPPPGPVGSDRDGAMMFFGCRPWVAEYEGQDPGIIPAPTTASRHDPATCPICRQALADPRITCAGCLTSGHDGRLVAEVVRDEARAEAKARREVESKGPQDFAHRKHGQQKE